MPERREKAVISADSHEGSEEADHPACHENNPYYDVWTEVRSAEDLQVEERDRKLDETNREDARYDEGVIVLKFVSQMHTLCSRVH